jgi:hypothetical protein
MLGFCRGGVFVPEIAFASLASFFEISFSDLTIDWNAIRERLRTVSFYVIQEGNNDKKLIIV